MLRVVCLAALVVPALASAQLTCPEPLAHRGSIKGGTVVQHVFPLVNSGRETLQILEVKTGCGCVRSEPAQRVLRAGEKTTLPIEVHTVTQPAGANLWGAELHYRTESGRTGVLNVRLTATLVPEVHLSPATLVLHTSAALHHPFLLTERRAAPLKLTALSTTSPYIKAEAGEAVQRGATWVRAIRLVVLPSCPEGRHECALSLATDDAAYPELRAPFTVIKKAERSIQASPAALEWLGRGNEPLPALLTVLHRGDDQPVLVEAVKCTHPAFRATFLSGQRATLRFVVDREKLPAEGVETVAEVRFRDESLPPLKIPLSVRLK